MGANSGTDLDEVRAGAAIYEGRTLRRYDRVLYVNTRFFWGCDKREILARYRDVVGSNHLEIGVGSGYCPDNTRFPGDEPRITLVDLNPETLAFAGRRLARYSPRRIQADALHPLQAVGVPVGSYDSVAINLLLHCVPGDLPAKDGVLANAAKAARPGGTVIGSTVLARGVPVTRRAKWLMDRKNAQGIFHNSEDSLDDLERGLRRHFASHTLDVRGCLAIFTAEAH